jgi:hypothetical protein
MKKSFGIGVIAAIAVLMSAACVIPYWMPESGSYPPRHEFHRVVAMEPGGTISLENASGDIEIRGWDKNEVEISAEEDWGPTVGWQSRLYGRRATAFGVDVDVNENILKIKTRLSKQADTLRSVNYYLNVPRSVNLQDVRNKDGDIVIADLYGKVKVDLEKGDITIENFSGPLDLLLGEGSVEAELLDLRPEDDVKITVKEGPITLLLQPDVDVRLDATAAQGTISSDFDLGQTLPAKKVSARIGKTEAASMSLTALDGFIRLNKAK